MRAPVGSVLVTNGEFKPVTFGLGCVVIGCFAVGCQRRYDFILCVDLKPCRINARAGRRQPFGAEL